ncbi:MAG: molybdopterin molybdotransferase MoeA [Chromatiales bacterium]|nr:molybdopterin molybdotransferase MoeA [Chromatiales bacterium]
MTSSDEALRLIRANVPDLPVSRIPLASLESSHHGAVVAAAVHAGRPLPGFDNAAMDGFAIRAADSAAATEAQPVALAVSGSVVAGQAELPEAAPGAAIEIMTGAVLPPGCDTVLPLERSGCERDADGRPRRIRLTAPVRQGANVRRAGEDYATGDLVAGPGMTLSPERLMALAAHGVGEVSLRLPARVGLLTTGRELGDARRTAQINDSNGPYLASWLARAGCTISERAWADDDPGRIADTVARLASQSDLVITTGGVSAGRLDAVPGALARLGAETVWHKLAIRPGKPVLFARLPEGPPLFGLPGNPIAVAVGLRFFVAAALRQMLGLPPEEREYALSDSPVRARPGLTFFGKARITLDASGKRRVALLEGQESFRIRPLAEANGWLVLPAGQGDVAPGTPVQVASLSFPPA